MVKRLEILVSFLQNEEILARKSSISFVCINLIDISAYAVAVTCFSIRDGLLKLVIKYYTVAE